MSSEDEVSITPLHSDASRRLFAVNFFHRRIITTVTRRPATVRGWLHQNRRWVHQNRRCMIVGLGLQWRPKDHKSDPDPQVSTIQLCVGSRCLIFHSFRADSIPSKLRRFLAEDSVTFVGVGIARDCRMLDRYCGLRVANPVEVRDLAARRMGRRNASMAKMAWMILGCPSVGRAKKPRVGMSRWDVSNLSHKQIIYACVDAHVSLRLAVQLILSK